MGASEKVNCDGGGSAGDGDGGGSAVLKDVLLARWEGRYLGVVNHARAKACQGCYMNRVQVQE